MEQWKGRPRESTAVLTVWWAVQLALLLLAPPLGLGGGLAQRGLPLQTGSPGPPSAGLQPSDSPLQVAPGGALMGVLAGDFCATPPPQKEATHLGRD